MIVRLAFAVMVQADADIMLVDEVLAVGDASFAQKCMDVFREKRRKAGKTVVLVTHDMATVQSFCHRAMLLHDGELLYIGDPEEAALRYYRLNFGGHDDDEGPQPGGVPDVNARVVDAWLEDDAGERVENVEQGEPIGLERRRRGAPGARTARVRSSRPQRRRGARVRLQPDARATRRRAGSHARRQRVRISGQIENPLVPGRYFGRTAGSAATALRATSHCSWCGCSTSWSTARSPAPGVVSVAADVEAVLEQESPK